MIIIDKEICCLEILLNSSPLLLPDIDDLRYAEQEARQPWIEIPKFPYAGHVTNVEIMNRTVTIKYYVMFMFSYSNHGLDLFIFQLIEIFATAAHLSGPLAS